MSLSAQVAELESALERARSRIEQLEGSLRDPQVEWQALAYEELCVLLEDHRRGIVDLGEIYERALGR